MAGSIVGSVLNFISPLQGNGGFTSTLDFSILRPRTE